MRVDKKLNELVLSGGFELLSSITYITMASKSLESRSEIEGAKRQLVIAQKWRTSANDMLKVITQSTQVCGESKQIIEFAREQLSLSEKEVHEAQAYLKKVEARWEVIDVDDNEPPISSSSTISSKVQNNTNISHAPSLSNNQSNTRLNNDAVILSDDSNDAEDKTNNAAAAVSAALAPTTSAPRPPTFNIGNKVMLQNSTPTYNNQIGIIKSKPNDTLYTIELLVSKKLVNAKLINMKLYYGTNESVSTGAASTSNNVISVETSSTAAASSTRQSTVESSLVIGSKVILKGMTNASYNGQQGVIKSITSSHHAGCKTVYTISLPGGKEAYAFLDNMQQVEQNDAVVNSEAVSSTSTNNNAESTCKANDTLQVKSEKEQIVLELSSDDEEEDYIPHHLTVHGCGSNDINGTFTLTGMHNGAPRYTKQTYSSLYSIQLEIESSYPKDIKKWLLLGRTNDGTVCHSSARADGIGNLPPSHRWKNQRLDISVKGGGSYAGKGVIGVQLSLEPKISHAKDRAYFNTDGKSKNTDGVINNQSEIVDELCVEGCVDEINGIYKKNGYINDAPSYFKARSSDGLPCVNIYRGERCYWQDGCRWYISVLKGDTWFVYYYITECRDGLPITRDWKRRDNRASGMLPLVKLATGRSNKRARTS